MKELKEAIQQVTNIEVSQQRLIYMGRIVENDLEKISSYVVFLFVHVDITFLTIVECSYH